MHAGDTFALLAPLSGLVVPIESVPDPVFADKVVGDGISIDPTSQVLLAPCDATVTQLHAARHAITLRTPAGIDILIHIGIDTVGLKGQGFKARVVEGDKVSRGQTLIEFDADYLLHNAASLLTQVIVMNGDTCSIVERASGVARAGVSSLMTVRWKPNGAAKAPEGSRGDAGPDPRPGQHAEGARGAPGLGTSGIRANGSMVSAVVAVPGPYGLHARPAALLANEARAFAADIGVEFAGRRANGKSVVSLLHLGAGTGAELSITASGREAARAVNHLIEFIRGGLGEGPSTPQEAAPGLPLAPPTSDDPRRFHGVTAAPGLALGPVYKLDLLDVEVEERGADPQTELMRLHRAIQRVRVELKQLIAGSGRHVEQAQIFSAHLAMLDDPEINARVEAAVQEGQSAAFAWREAMRSLFREVAAIDNPLLAARADDLRDVGGRALLHLVGGGAPTVPAGSIVLSEVLSPSDVVRLAEKRVAGFVTVLGGTTSHAAILARSLGLPYLVGVPSSLLSIRSGQTAVLDTEKSMLLLGPSAAEFSAYRQRLGTRGVTRSRHEAAANEPATTRDGVHVEVLSSIVSADDAREAVRLGAEGVGLLRTELMFLDREVAPTEAEQVAAFQAIANALDGRRFTIRTLDVGGDKPLPYVPLPAEDNPLLGLRGVRINSLQPAILRGQLRAILAARLVGAYRIMLPMVSTLEELHQAKQMLEEERRSLDVPPVELGVMVEVPSVAVQADRFAAEVDFFSIGTNDLTQYTLAMDRTHPRLATRQDALHPAVLRLIDATVQAARKHARPVGVCGALASDPDAVAILIGLGVTELSVSVAAVPEVKARIRELEASRCRELAKAALDLGSAVEVRALLSRGSAA